MSPRSVLHTSLSTVVLLVAAAALAACGGGSDSDDEDIVSAVLEDAMGGADSDEAATGGDGDGDGDDGDDDDPVIPGQGSFSGLASLVIGGTTYELLSDDCVPEQPDEIVDSGTRFSLIGEGQVGGDQMYGKVLRTEVDFDGDGTKEVLHTISIEVGGEEGFQAPPDKPSLLVQLSEADVANGLGELSVVFEPGRLGGTGRISDRNGVLAATNESLQFSFVATCVPAG